MQYMDLFTSTTGSKSLVEVVLAGKKSLLNYVLVGAAKKKVCNILTRSEKKQKVKFSTLVSVFSGTNHCSNQDSFSENIRYNIRTKNIV